MLRKKLIVGSVFILLMFTLAFVPRPIPEASPENTVRTYGIIEEVSESNRSGLVFKLRGDDRLYYINSANEPQLRFASLQKELPGQAAEIYYLRHWAATDLLSRRNVVARMQVNQTTVYSAFNNERLIAR
jgi:hypothetical protein